jgi:hypothetical protein
MVGVAVLASHSSRRSTFTPTRCSVVGTSKPAVSRAQTKTSGLTGMRVNGAMTTSSVQIDGAY